MDAKQAYEILGLKDGAGREEIERRFSILLKKHKMESLEGKSAVDIDNATAAYNLLMGYSTEEPMQSEYKASRILKWLGIDEKKFRNFIYYYKFHIIIGILLVIGAIYTINSIVTRVEPDLKVAFIGDMYYRDSEVISDKISQEIPEIKAAEIDNAFIYPSQNDNSASETKATILLAAGNIDLYILDKSVLEPFSFRGGLKNLDSIAAKLGVPDEKKVKAEYEGTESVYGIDVSNSRFLKDVGVSGEELVAALGVSGKFEENAQKLLELLLKYNPEEE